MAAPLILVEHDTADPVRDCVAAAAMLALAKQGGAGHVEFVRLTSGTRPRDESRFQHVAQVGALLDNAWLWPERLSGEVAAPGGEGPPDRIKADAATVVSLNHATAPGIAASDIVGRWRGSRSVLHLRVAAADDMDVVEVAEDEAGNAGRPIAHWTYDPYSRPMLSIRDSSPVAGRLGFSPDREIPGTPARSLETGGTILVVGEEDNLRRVYPAILAALGDAADAVGIAPEIRIVSPRGLSHRDADEMVRAVDGIVLPGGCDNSQVEGQIRIAGAALSADTPVLGCCFGMQTMVTALVRQRLNAPRANLEEVDPLAEPAVFTRMRNPDGNDLHRLGLRSFDVTPGTQAAAVYGRQVAAERMHHRYRLDPGLWPRVRSAGLVISGRPGNERIADVIELPECRFFVGVQGHPELSSTATRPHPIFRAFLSEAVGVSGGHDSRSMEETHEDHR